MLYEGGAKGTAVLELTRGGCVPPAVLIRDWKGCKKCVEREIIQATYVIGEKTPARELHLYHMQNVPGIITNCYPKYQMRI